ncbi:hypothetical protein P153DRAFT_380376 [Dothidotthia symphoricarpi CBS 119687]|uniref:Uncharacterized protein n=1 Tax=Dothidotthia symphoricarpi CBS 119687 TaxID=1392245 RepID=A0A6A6AVK7_9PLEO|nr:uncharacterized protein P153DRAFT_380376 [Dothidotthia symphoricarpi CBS 119687]KAF2134561.1 hypothetical protein P153DRAFT_380376 [Dothidotthia symphoricarpi CBS 119687]
MLRQRSGSNSPTFINLVDSDPRESYESTRTTDSGTAVVRSHTFTSPAEDSSSQYLRPREGHSADATIEQLLRVDEDQSEDATTEQHTISNQYPSNAIPKEKAAHVPAQTYTEQPKMWNPFWLRKRWLISYATLFGVLAFAVLALYLVSVRLNGLGASKSTTEMIYLWRFCPTTVLVAVLALWNPVDYFTRLLQPWLNLSKGPASASRTLFLDLVSPLQPVILYSAIKNFEWPVVLTTIVAIALTAIKIISTGLLTIQSTSLSVSNFTLTKTATFDASLWNSSYLDTEAVSFYSGIHRENLTQPPWTTDHFVVEPFTLPADDGVPSNLTYAATTNGVFPGLDCDEAKLTQEPSYYNGTTEMRANMTFRSNSCETRVILDLADGTQAFDRQYKWAGENYVGEVQAIDCSGQTQFLVTVTQANKNLKVTNYSALICRPFYRVEDVTVHVDEAGQHRYEYPTSSGHTNFQLDNLDPTTVFAYVVNASRNAPLPWVEPSGNITEGNFAFLTLAAISFTKSNPGNSYLKPLLDVQTLSNSVSNTFAGIFSLLVYDQMLRPQRDYIQGNSHYSEDRLHVKKLPTVMIVVMFLLCLISTTILLFVKPVDVVTYDPNSIVGIATTLGPIQVANILDQPHFKSAIQALKGHKLYSTTPASRHSRVHGTRFDIIVDPSFQDEELNVNNGGSGYPKRSAWWCPFTLNIWVRVVAILLCLATTVVLEILQRNSDHSHGFAEVTLTGNGHFWVTVVPALWMTGIALLYSSIHFNIALLAPYHTLTSKSGATARRSIITDYLGSTPLFILFQAIQKRHLATAISAFAAILGAFLTIFVSGLYTTEPFTTNVDFEVQRGDEWNVSWPFAEGDSSAGQALQFITWRNLSEPQWTYNDLAFPSIYLPNYAENATLQEKITTALPARRAVLNCTAVGPADNVVSVSSYGSAMIYTKVLNTCSGGPGKELPLRISKLDIPTSYGGSISQLLFDPRGTSATSLDPNPDHPSYNSDDQACPSLSFFFGSFQNVPVQPETNYTSPPLNLSSTEAKITTLACAQMIQELDTRVTFLLPDLSIDTSTPPLPDESSMRYIGGVYQFPVVAPLQSTFDVLSSNTTFKTDTFDLGTFFAAVVYGKDGIPAPEIVGEENIPRLISGVSDMYGRYMAQVMSRKMRTLINPNGQNQTSKASLTTQKFRLVQHPEAKVALQALLGVMMLCGILSWATMRRVKILPHDPCSIAGTACFLAGREFWGEDATGSKEHWLEDQVFRLEMRGDRFGIYAGNAESGRLVS